MARREVVRTPWREKSAQQKAAMLGAIVGAFLGSAIIVFALASYVTHKSFTVENTKKDLFTIDLTGQVEGVELSPGDSQSVAYTITNTGTVKMYAFVRLNTSVAPSGESSVYSFAPGGGWQKVEMPFPEELVYCYGDGEPIALEPGSSATLSGTLTVDVDNASFAALADDALHYTVTGCAISSDADGASAQGLYAEYISAGGE